MATNNHQKNVPVKFVTRLYAYHGGWSGCRDVRNSRAAGDELALRCKQISSCIYCSQKRKINEGDKMAGRHGNKGGCFRIMPKKICILTRYRPVDIMLNPLGVPSRTWTSDVELHLGMYCSWIRYLHRTGQYPMVQDDVWGTVAGGMARDAKQFTMDAQVNHSITVSVGLCTWSNLPTWLTANFTPVPLGPYSLVTQQPLGGKVLCGQRFGEWKCGTGVYGAL